MTTAYRIAGWAEYFENNRSRELKSTAWVPMPNKHDGDGFTQLMDHKNGAAHFGAWVLIVQVASRCDVRGTLLRQGRTGVRMAHDALSLSRMTRCPASVFDEAFARLLTIGWLELISLETLELVDQPHDDATSPHASATAPHDPALKERKKEVKEQNGKNGTAPAALPQSLDTPEFREVWAEWVQYRKEKGEKAYQPTGLKAALTELSNRGVVTAIKALRFSMAKNWKGPAEDSWMANGNGKHDEARRQAGTDPERQSAYANVATVVEVH